MAGIAFGWTGLTTGLALQVRKANVLGIQPRQEGVEVANPREAVIRPAIGNRCGDGMPQVKLISSRSPSSLLRIIIRVTRLTSRCYGHVGQCP